LLKYSTLSGIGHKTLVAGNVKDKTDLITFFQELLVPGLN